MLKSAFTFGIALSLAALTGCSGDNQGNATGNRTEGSATKDGASSKTVAAGLPANGRFMTAAKAAGLDQTLAGSDSYTVLVPDDAAFDKQPAGSFDQLADPQSRAKVTQLLTLHILPGEVRAADITKAIENSKGKATLMTMSGATLTATQEGGKIVLTDASGGKATISKADDRFSNGVVHHIDILLTPSRSGGPAQ